MTVVNIRLPFPAHMHIKIATKMHLIMSRSDIHMEIALTINILTAHFHKRERSCTRITLP